MILFPPFVSPVHSCTMIGLCSTGPLFFFDVYYEVINEKVRKLSGFIESRLWN